MRLGIGKKFEVYLLQAQDVYLVIGYHFLESLFVALHYAQPQIVIYVNLTLANQLFGKVVESV